MTENNAREVGLEKVRESVKKLDAMLNPEPGKTMLPDMFIASEIVRLLKHSLLYCPDMIGSAMLTSWLVPGVRIESGLCIQCAKPSTGSQPICQVCQDKIDNIS